MIRKYEEKDRENILKIWIENIKICHDFIDESYWESAFDIIKDRYLMVADTYVYEVKGVIRGFVSVISDDAIWGIFVDQKYQRQGIGSKLIRHIQNIYDILSISIYKKNEGVIWFCKNQDFKFEHSQRDVNTGEEEMLFLWREK